MVEVMASFERSGVERVLGEQARIEEPIGDVEHPDGEEHCQNADHRETNMVGRGDEPSPERGDGGGVEREEMPAIQRRHLRRAQLLEGDWGQHHHISI